jgi:hypothetical protein
MFGETYTIAKVVTNDKIQVIAIIGIAFLTVKAPSTISSPSIFLRTVI